MTPSSTAYDPTLDPNAASSSGGSTATAAPQLYPAPTSPSLSQQNNPGRVDPTSLMQAQATTSDPAIALYEAQARQLVNNSFSTLGQIPNPQLATEALTTGATSDVLSALTSPTTAGYIGALPGGGQAPGPHNGPGTSGPDVYTMDWKQYWGDQPKELNDESNAGFRTLGATPRMNLGWMQGVLTNSGPDAIRKWQSTLHSASFLAPGSDPNHDSFKPSGVWDKDSIQAFESYMIQMATPEALYAKDTNRMNQARAFLAGMGQDWSQLAQKVSTDPGSQQQMIAAWIATQGSIGQREGLKGYIDRFGKENVPLKWQHLADGGIIGGITDALSSVFGGLGGDPMPSADTTGKVTPGSQNLLMGAAGVMNLILNGVHGHLSLSDPRKQEVQNLGLSKTDLELLHPAIQQAQSSSGFLPFDWWDKQKTHFILSASYFFGDALGKGKVSNPFDDTGSIHQGAWAHEQDLLGGLIPNFAQDHPDLDKWGNLATNIIDDPLTYVGGVTRLGRLGKDLAAISRGKRDAMPGLAGLTPHDLISTKGEAVGRFLNPKKSLYGQMAKLLTHPEVRDSHWMQLQLLGVNDTILRNEPDVAKAMESLRGATDPSEALRVIHDQFGHKVLGVDGVFNFKQHLRALSPQVQQRMGDSFLTRLRTTGGFKDSSKELNHAAPLAQARTLQERMALGGVDSATSDRLANEYIMAKQEEREYIAQKVDVALEQQLVKRGASLSHVTNWANSLIRGRSFSRSLPMDAHALAIGKYAMTAYAPKLDETGKVIDASRAPIEFSDKLAAELRDHDSASQALQATTHELVDLERRRILRANPEMPHDQAEAQALSEAEPYLKDAEWKMQEILKRVQELAPLGRDKQVPMWSYQLATTSRLPFSNYELAAFLNHKLHRTEDLQATLRMDAFTNIWKPLALMRPGTVVRMAEGDDIMRLVLEMATKGHGFEAMKTMLGASGKGLAAGFGGLGAPIATAAARGVQNVGRRLGIGKDAEAITLHNPGERFTQAGTVDFKSSRLKRVLGKTGPFEGKSFNVIDGIMADPATQQKVMIAGWVGEIDPARMVSYLPGDGGYERMFMDYYKTVMNSPDAKVMAQAWQDRGPAYARQQLEAYHEQLGGPQSAELADTQKTDLSGLTNRQWEYFNSTLAPHPALRKWAAAGKVDEHEFRSLYRDPEFRNVLPPIVAPRQTLFSRNVILRGLEQGPKGVFQHMAEPMIAAARSDMQRRHIAMYMQEIKKVHPEWDDTKVFNRAAAESEMWAQNNLYQGSRSIMGRSLRNVFPFWGATSNMARFATRMVRVHPWTLEPGLRAANWAEQRAASRTGDTPMTGMSGILTTLGFTGGDMLNANLAQPFFFTADGIASFIPGMGPIVTPIFSMVSNNQMIADAMSNIPGLREQLNYSGGPGAHPLFPWIEKILSGIGLVSPLHKPFTVPLIGGDSDQYQRTLDNKYKQMYADYLANPEKYGGNIPTAQDAATELGKEELAVSGVNLVAPLAATMSDPRRTELTKAENVRAAQGIDAAIQQFPDLAPLLRYNDPGASLAQRNQIAADTPWVVPYATSIYETKAQQKPVGLNEYDQYIASGNLHALGIDQELAPLIQKNLQYNEAWAQMNQLKARSQAYLAANQLTTTSPQYKQWYAATIQPLINGPSHDALFNKYPDWQDQFMKETRRDALGLEVNSRPLRTLMTWEVLPQHSDYETQKSILWRNTLKDVQDFGGGITQLRAQGGSKAEVDQLIDVFRQRINAYAAQDPAFAQEIRQFTFAQWTDLVNYEAQTGTQAMEATAYYSGKQ